MKSILNGLTAPLTLLILLNLAGCAYQAKRVVNLQPPACSEEPDPGYCSAEISKYYFDSSEGACQEFAWGGCGGLIPFETKQACEQACLGIDEPEQPED